MEAVPGIAGSYCIRKDNEAYRRQAHTPTFGRQGAYIANALTCPRHRVTSHNTALCTKMGGTASHIACHVHDRTTWWQPTWGTPPATSPFPFIFPPLLHAARQCLTHAHHVCSRMAATHITYDHTVTLQATFLRINRKRRGSEPRYSGGAWRPRESWGR